MEKQIIIASMGAPKQEQTYERLDWSDEAGNYLGTVEFPLESICLWCDHHQIQVDKIFILTTPEAVGNVKKFEEQIAQHQIEVIQIPISMEMNYLSVADAVRIQLEQLAKHSDNTYRIHLDITNGFRTIPMLIEMTLQYLMTSVWQETTTQEIVQRVTRGYTLYANQSKKVIEDITMLHFVQELSQGLQQYKQAKSLVALRTLKAEYKPLILVEGQLQNDQQNRSLRLFSAFFDFIDKTDSYMEALKINALRELVNEKQQQFEGAHSKIQQQQAYYLEAYAQLSPILAFLVSAAQEIYQTYAQYFIIMQKQTTFTIADWQDYVKNSQRLIRYHYENKNSAQFFTVVKEYVITRMMYASLEDAQVCDYQPWDDSARNDYTDIYNTVIHLANKQQLSQFFMEPQQYYHDNSTAMHQVNARFWTWIEQVFFEQQAGKYYRHNFLKVSEYRNKINHGDLSSDGLNTQNAIKSMEDIYQDLATYLFIADDLMIN